MLAQTSETLIFLFEHCLNNNLKIPFVCDSNYLVADLNKYYAVFE